MSNQYIEPLHVTGRVLNPDGSPSAGLKIQAHKRQFNKAPNEGDMIGAWGTLYTDAKGYFDLYTSEVDVDVVVLAIDENYYNTIVAASPTLYGVRGLVEIDLVVSGEENYVGPTEFERVDSAVSAQLAGSGVTFATADETHVRDLAGLTKIDPVRVSACVLAYRLHSEAAALGLTDPNSPYYPLPIPSVPALYAIVSSEVIRSLAEVRLIEPSAREALLVRAGERRVIEPLSPAQIAEIHAFFAELQATKAIAPGGNLGTTLGDILTIPTVDLDNQQLRDFYDRYTQRTGTVADFWTALEAAPGFDSNLVKRVQFALALATVTGMHSQATQAIALEFQLPSATLANIADRTAVDWYAWLNSKQIEPPASIDGSSLSERRQNYANRMASIIEHALPTAVLRARMADDTQSDEGGVRAFLDATPEFDFASHRFSRYVREKSLNLSSIGDAETIKSEATAVQRLFSIVPAVNRMNNIRALRGCGFDSAAKIVGAGKRRFLAQMNTWGVDASVARSIFREAGRSAAAAVAIYADRSQAFRRGALPVTREDDALSEFAELSSMFGSLDGCDCGACRSAFGAAAYLTDLLFFLEQCDGAGVTRSGVAVPTGLDAIKARRPDLSKIKLSCENSNHKLPAIDLAIEALEVEVERLSLGVVADAAYDRQTTGSEAALRLAPEHRRDAAYAALAAASTPWSLPYHRETDASLSYLRLSGVHPADLVRTVYPQASIDRGEFARLELGMSSAEFALLASDDAQSPKDLWGYPSGIPTSIPLRTFLDRTGCTLDEALQIVACRYPNQGQIAAEPATVNALTIDIANCSIDDEASVVAKMYPERARRIYRLVRLQRRTGRSFSELDTVLAALGEPAVPVTPAPAAGAMIRFAEAIALQRAFGFSAEELAAIAKARTDYASELARGSAFARALGLSTTDATTLSSRLEVTSGAARTENDPFGWASDELERMRAIVDGRVSVAALDEFLRHEGPTASASTPTDAALTASWNAIRASKSNASESTERAIIEECSRVLRAPEPVVDYLCKSCFAVGGASLFDTIVADASESAPSYFEDALRRATKLVALRSLLGVDDDAFEHFVRWLKRRGFAFDAIAIEVCEDHPEGLVEHIVEAAKAKVICDSLGLRSASLYEVLAVVPETGAIDRIAFEARVAALLGAQPALIDHVTDKLGITANSIGGAVPWRSTRGIEAVRRALRLMNATGATQIDALQSWMSFSTQSIADAIASAARAKLGDDAFASAAIAAADAMRTRQRDALVAYLVHALGLRSAGDLYTRLLVDVEMSPCMLTTRVLHATSCVQNLLQRASMNLDAAAKWTELETKPAMARVTLTSDDARTWGWMKNYRVWEAARRVLLYPENYVEPELRTDATPAFDDLTRVLEQGDLDERATENAFRAYLRSLEEVSSLDVCAMTVEPRGDKHKIFHVFGRTRTTPRTYHYCSYDSLSGWSAWQATKLDVGDSHIVPVVFAGRLYVYWPVFIEQAIEGAIERLADGESKRHKKRWEVRIAGARFEDQRWTQPFVSECSCATQSLVQKARISILPKIGPGSLELILSNTNFFDQLESPTSDYREVFGAMETNDGVFFRKSNREASLVHNRQYTAPPATDLLESRLINDGSVAALSVPFVDSAGSVMVRADVFGLTQRGFALVQPVESEHFVGVQPFFYADSERVYFLLPSPNFEVMARQLGKPSMITPENADRLLGEHDRSVMFELADGPRFGAIGAGVFSGPIRDIARDPRRLSPNGGAGKFTIPTSITPNIGLVVRQSGNTQQNARSGIIGFDAASVITGLLSTSGASSAALARSPLRYRVVRFDRPFVNRLRSQLERYGVDALFAPPEGSDTSLLRQQTTINDFAARYAPTTAVSQPLPVARFDFNNESPNSAYNWELFFYAPWTIANRLRSQQKFEQALRWMRFIFDPMDAGTATGPERFWRFKPLADDVRSSDSRTSLLELLDYAGDDAAHVQRRIEAERMIARWRRDPFDPHNIARTRLVAYERAIAMRTVEMLIEWGDNAFRRSTRESVQEAAQLYVTAASLLGRRPEKLPERTGTPPKSYDELRAAPPSGAIAALEAMLPPSELGADDVSASDASTAVGPSLMYADGTYFCVPMNDELTRFWDIVADRLFKLRHCKDIDGASLDLPLYEPPIDPRLLVRARSLGMSIADVLSDASPAAQSPYRFTYLLSRALDFTNDVRSMGATLLSVIEKRDAEELAQVRQTIEREMSTAIRRVREQQVDEARAQRATLDQSRATVQRRIEYFRALIKKGLNVGEATHIQNIFAARALQDQVFAMQTASQALALLPDFQTGTSGLGPLAALQVGGAMYSRFFSLVGHVVGHEAEVATHEGNIANLTGGFERRKADWEHQLSQSESELIGVDKQIAAADIRVAIAENELRNHELAFAHSERTESFLTSKFSSRALYDWMVRRLTVLHRQAYVLAFDLARKAQVAFALELGDESATLFVRFGQWDSQRSGLLSGDELHADLRRMETAFMDRNERPYEITKTVSLATLDPVALVKLRSTGECHVTMPEAIFDVDHPDHVRRVIRSVSVTVPSVSSAFDSVPMKVTLASGKVRFSAAPPIARSAKVNSIVLSHGQNDSGLFETNLRDERLLPFEGAGLIDSEWQLSLPQERAFDYDSIADVVFTIRYTAKTGAARSNIRAALDSASRNGSNLLTGDTTGGFLMLSMKDDLPAEWQAYLSSTGATRTMTVPLTASRFPFIAERASSLKIQSVRPVLVHRASATNGQLGITKPSGTITSVPLTTMGGTTPALTTGVYTSSSPGADAGTWTITTDSTNGPHLNDNDHSDLILIVRYTMT